MVTFAVDPDTGKMTPTGPKSEMLKPTCGVKVSIV
jgi:hypothetical protein